MDLFLIRAYKAGRQTKHVLLEEEYSVGYVTRESPACMFCHEKKTNARQVLMLARKGEKVLEAVFVSSQIESNILR